MAEQRGDRFEAHPSVDRLRGQRVAQLVRCDPSDPGRGSGFGDGPFDPGGRDRAALVDEDQIRSEILGTVGQPLIEEFFEAGVQRDVAVVVQLADGDAQPEGRADLDDGVDRESEELAATQPGAGEV
jgi:hypothetical protein